MTQTFRGRFRLQGTPETVDAENVEVSVVYTENDPPKPGLLGSLAALFVGKRFRAWRGSALVSKAQGVALETFGSYRLELQDGRSGDVNVTNFNDVAGVVEFVGTGPLQ